MKLLVSEYEVKIAETVSSKSMSSEFFVKLNGPRDSPYEGVSVYHTKLCIIKYSVRNQLT